MENEQLKIEEKGEENFVLGLSLNKTQTGDRSWVSDKVLNHLEPKDASILLQELAKIENPAILKNVCYEIFVTWDGISDDIDCLLTEEEWENDEDVVFTDKEVSKRTLAYYLDDVKMILRNY